LDKKELIIATKKSLTIIAAGNNFQELFLPESTELMFRIISVSKGRLCMKLGTSNPLTWHWGGSLAVIKIH